MAKQRGLGKGLDALLGGATLTEETAEVLSLPISQVEPSMEQPRKNFDDDSLSDLADSIRVHGVLQPLTVRRLGSGYYQIIAGERRWRAAKQAGLENIPVIVLDADDRKVMELSLIENLQRKDLDPIEEANGYAALKDEYGLTQDEIADRVGKSRPAVANALRLLSLSRDVQKMVSDGQLSAGHARAIAVLDKKTQQLEAARETVDRGLSVRQTEALVKKIQNGSESKGRRSSAGKDPNKIYYDALEEELSTGWGRRVSIVPGKRKGTIRLEYYGEDDLESLLSSLRNVKKHK
ncbi:MAG: ParB/RepB/Spo0J family partition protein [Oscillospiraceae bacterium]|nr:ParB/RepB/Spo0J family partition protein [Oscillospiraceae bacterium]